MATALIAEDEPLLAMALKAELLALWPELEILAEVADGQSALDSALKLQPQILFLDIRMPEMTGIEAALELVDAWNPAQPFPSIVFVTAYDEYALQAFEARAIDYLVKPVQRDRLQKTVARLKAKLTEQMEALSGVDTERGKATGSNATVSNTTGSNAGISTNLNASVSQDMDNTLAQLRALLQSGFASQDGGSASTRPGSHEKLTMIQAGVGNQIRMIPIDDVSYFEAADKYVRVITHDSKDWLIRKPLKELIDALDGTAFWQIHRGVVVRASAIERVTRDEQGKLSLRMRGQSGELAVSRLYAHLFKAM